MKPKKTFKSLAELPTDALGVIEAEPEKIRPPDAQLLLEALRKIPPDSLPRVPDFRGLRDWGINE